MLNEIAEGWPEVTVEEVKADQPNALATGPFGSSISARYFKDFGVPVIRGSNLSEDVGVRLLTKDLVFLAPEKAAEFSRSIVRRGDLVFTCWGTIGQVGLIDEGSPFSEYVISNKQMKLTPCPTRADSIFLYYLFSGPEMSARIKAQSIGSSVPGFNLSQLRRLSFRLPPLAEQKAIACLLGSLDAKLTLNQHMNQTLEAMARAIFKSWFVDFDPVREGHPLFPKHLEGSRLGSVPVGWPIFPIGEVVTVVGGATPSTSEQGFWNGPYHFATPRDMARLTDPILTETERTITPEGLSQIGSGLLPPGAVLLSSRAPIGYLAITDIPVAVNQGFIAMICKGDLPNLYVFEWAKHNMETIVGNANGTTFLEISKRNFRPIPVLVPPRPVLDSFGAIASPMFQKITANIKESRTLAALRDTLLPKLLSGEIRVKQAEKIVGEAT